MRTTAGPPMTVCLHLRHLGAVAALLSATWLRAVAQDVVFDDRASVNVLNASNVVLTCGAGEAPGKLRASCSDNTRWDGVANPPGGTNWLAMDFGVPRSIKTIRLYQYPGAQALTGTVATSSDGSLWTPQPHSWTSNGLTTEIVLDAAVSARHLRLDATDINDGTGNNRWIVYSFRVFGDAGTLSDAAGVIDLVSSSGFSGGVTLTRNGTVSIVDTTDAEYVDDALDPLKRQLLYSISTNDGFTIQFDRDFVFHGIGLSFVSGDTNSDVLVEVSSNGTAYAAALAVDNFPAPSLNYFPLPLTRGRYVRVTFTNTAVTDNRIGDIQVFGLLTTTNRAPVAHPQDLATPLNTRKSIVLTGSDLDGDPLSFSIVTHPSHGSLSGTAPNLQYRPVAGFFGSDAFTFKVNDGTVDSPAATVNMAVAPDGAVVFNNRASVNILNASNAVLSCGQGPSVGRLRSAHSDSAFWDGIANPPGGTNWIAVDFRDPRSIRTLRLYHYPGAQALTGTVSTSSDGASWTPRSHSWTSNGLTTEIVLDAAVSARHLRLDATDINDGTGNNRWIVYSFRVFGETGTLIDTNATQDLVADGGIGTVTFSRVGTVNIADTVEAEYVNDALSPLKRQLLWNLGAGDGFKLEFERDVVFSGAGFNFHSGNTASSFTLEVSTNDVSYQTVLSRSSYTLGLDYYPLSVATGRYVRFLFTASGSADNRITDVHLFGSEPQVWVSSGTVILIR